LNIFQYYPPTSKFAEVEVEAPYKNDGDKIVCKKTYIKSKISLLNLIDSGVKFILNKVDWDNKKTTNTGNYSAATNTGHNSAATNTGRNSAATNTGDCSAATNTGDNSAATNTGDNSAATNTGDNSAATNTGNYSAATNAGNDSAATNTGDCSAATNTGDRSAATNTGDYSAAIVEGNNSISIVTGRHGKAKGKINCWLVLTEKRDIDNIILDIQAVKVDGENIKEDVFYTLLHGKITKTE
jgi:hypothetical protein